MVGAGRFERPTPCAQDIRSPHLRINRFNNLQTLRVGPCGNFSYNLDGKPAIRLAKPPTKPTGSPAGSADCKINQRGRAPAVAAVGRSVVERLADPSYNRDFGQVPGHFPESRFHGQWHRLRVARDTTGALNGALRTSVNTARQGGSYFNLRAFRDSFRMAKINRSKSAWTQVSA